jgi:hypothetical protein
MIITTHTDGLVRLYRMNGDNALVQVGQLEATQTLDPVILATMVGDLTVALGWEHAAKPVIEVVKVVTKTAPAKTPKPKARPKTKRISKAESEARKIRVLDLLATEPMTAPEVGAELFPLMPRDKADGAARGILDDLVKAGKLHRLAKPAPGKAAPYARTT